MPQTKTLMTNYSTIEYRDKIEKEQKAAIARLLTTLPPYITDYNNYKKSKVAVKTRREYIQDINTFFLFLQDTNPYLKAMEMRDIPLETLSSLKLDDFGEYENWLQDEDTGNGYNSPTTIKRKKSSLRSLFDYLYASEKIDINPVAKIEKGKADRKKREDIRVLSNEERVLFLSRFDEQFDLAVQQLQGAETAAKEKGKPVPAAARIKPALVKRDKAIVYLFLGTGLRISELCAINCNDIVPELQRINVIRKGEGNDKNKSRTDYVLLSNEVMNVLAEYINEYRDSIGPDTENYDALFLSSKHTRITPRAIEQMVKQHADATLGANSGVHPHVLRASFGDRYQATYGDILSTSEVMNHASVDVTAKHYLHRREDSKVAAQKVPIG